MKKIAIGFTLLGCIALGSTVLAHGVHDDKKPAVTDVLQFFGPTHVIFAEKSNRIIQETQQPESIETTFEVWFSPAGQYRMNTILGPSAGDFEIWDGTNLLQYTKTVNELALRDLSGTSDVPIPHLLFSKEITNRIKKDIAAGKMKENKTEGTNIYEDSGKKFKIKLDNSKSEIMEYSYTEQNAQKPHELKILTKEKQANFDDSLLTVDYSQYHVAKIQ